jgi:hypothetical protein
MICPACQFEYLIVEGEDTGPCPSCDNNPMLASHTPSTEKPIENWTRIGTEKPLMKTVTYQAMTHAAWSAYPKHDFDKLITRWCERHNFMEYVALGKKVCAKVPYRTGNKLFREDPSMVYVADDFIAMADAYHAKKIFQAPLL